MSSVTTAVRESVRQSMPDSSSAPSAALLRRMPKVELHCHLDGSLRPETMLELAREQRIALPRSDVEALREYMRADGTSSLDEYLTRFETTIAVLQTAEAIERVAYELVEDAARENVRYIEVRNAPRLNTRGGLTLDEVMRATLRGLSRGEARFGVQVRFIVCSLRHWAPDVSLRMAELAARYREQGVVAFDLAGGEAGHPAAAHLEAFRHARSRGVHVTCHAGEAAGAGSVAQAVYLCGAERVGHGVRAAEDPILVRYLAERRIVLEMCPTSNVQTCAVQSYAEHPLRRYYDAGIPVTINTDNRLISGTTLTDEFLHVAHHLGFTVGELAVCVEHACRGAFLPEDEREQLSARVGGELRTGWRENPRTA